MKIIDNSTEKRVFVTATKMLKTLNKKGLTAKRLNEIFVETNLMIKDENGYRLAESSFFIDKKNIDKETGLGTKVMFGKNLSKDGKGYVIWDARTALNKKLVAFLDDEFDSIKVNPKKVIPKKTKSMDDFKKSEAYNPSRDGAFNKLQDQIAVAKYLKDWNKVKELEAKVIPILRTVQGFEVRSMGECRIMDALTERYNLKVYSERQLDSDAVVYSDFFMKFRTAEFGLIEIWIELWAKKEKKGEEPKNSFEKSYLKRRLEKEDIYEKEGVILVNLEYSELMYDLDAQLLRAFNVHPALKKMGMKILDLRDSEIEFIKKFDR